MKRKLSTNSETGAVHYQDHLSLQGGGAGLISGGFMPYLPRNVVLGEGSQQNSRLVVGGEGKEKLRLLTKRSGSHLDETAGQQRRAPDSLEGIDGDWTQRGVTQGRGWARMSALPRERSPS